MKASKLIVLFGLATAQSNTWQSGDVQALCGFCKDGAACDTTNGNCPSTCATGWSGQRCDQPLCDVSCGDESGGGKCVAPNQCVCGYLHAQSEDGGCYSLRADGVKGAFMALGVMMVSISFCGGLQTYLTKGQKQQ